MLFFFKIFLYSLQVIYAFEGNLSKQVELAELPIKSTLEYITIKKLNFVVNQSDSIHLGYSTKTRLIKFHLKNVTNNSLHQILYLNSLNGIVNLYLLDDAHQKLIDLARSGSDLPWRLKNNKEIFSAFDLYFSPQEEHVFLLSIVGHHDIRTQLKLTTPESYRADEDKEIHFLNFYVGAMFFLVVGNFLIFIILKDLHYLYFTGSAFSLTLLCLVLQGRLDQFISLSNETFSSYLICFSSLALFMASWLAYHFLEVEKYFLKYRRVAFCSYAITLLIFILGLFKIERTYPLILGMAIDLLIMATLLFYIVLAIRLVKESIAARFYLVSWGTMFLGVVVWYAVKLNFLPMNSLTNNALPLANMGMLQILSLAITFKVQNLKKEKESAEARGALKEKYERLVHVLSHDIDNSLFVISTYSQKILNKGDDSVKKISEKILLASENIKGLLQSVHNQEQFNGKDSFSLRPISLVKSIFVAKDLLEDRLLLKKIRLQVSVPEHFYVMADKTCFVNNILMNILTNAIKFSFENSSIEIKANRKDDDYVLVIRDFGKGIPTGLIHDIFFSKKRIHTEGTNFERGQGLGTTIIHDYVLLFGGEMEVFSKTIEEFSDDHGTTIRLKFPVAQVV